MNPIKVLNLYAGIGGNRKLWENVEVTAVEINPKIAEIYQKFFPNDKVIVADAHQYLLEHFKEFDFIWSSPPCPTHSRLRRFLCVENKGTKPVFPDMKLYEEIIFLMSYFKGKFVVENVMSYYEPLIKPFIIERHYFWANFNLSDKPFKRVDIIRNTDNCSKLFGFDLTEFDITDKKKLIKNCVNPNVALHIFNMAFIRKQLSLVEEAETQEFRERGIEFTVLGTPIDSTTATGRKAGRGHLIEHVHPEIADMPAAEFIELVERRRGA